MRTLLELPAKIATAFFFAASIGIGAGAVTASGMQRLGPAFHVALVTFLIAAASFGYAIWRKHDARSRRMFGPLGPLPAPQRRSAPKQRRPAPAPRRRRRPVTPPGAVLSRS